MATSKKTIDDNSIHQIYVDGSYINGATGYGAVVLKNGEVISELYGQVHVSEVANTRQVAGELIAVRKALDWCCEHSVDEVEIYYDYLGIEKWATRQWKANHSLTKDYARFMNECSIKIHWHKVDSHTGNFWNDRADALAKQGAGSVQTTNASASDLINELIETAKQWIEFLMVRGIDSRFERVYNDQFARIHITQQDAVVGTFDLYNTKKKRLSPYVHDFKEEELKRRIEKLWLEFRG